MLQRVRSRLTYANVMSTLAVFLVLGGGAYAAVKIGKDSVKSKQIKAGAVKNADLADNAVTSQKVANGSLLAEDFAGQLSGGRAFGLVSRTGVVSRSRNVVGNAVVDAEGKFCVTLDPSVNAADAVVIAQTDLADDETFRVIPRLAFAKGDSDAPGCAPNSVAVQTGYFDGDPADNNAGGDKVVFTAQPFFFVVP